MKIKIFTKYNTEALENEVNDFIRNVKVLNMQLTVKPAPNDQFTQYTILLQYSSI